MTLNASFYEGHRDLVRDKLGIAAVQFIEGLTLG
jgi:hypothetical protein